MQPINYGIDVLSPFQTAVQGYGIGSAIRDDQLAQQDRQMKIEAEQRQQEAAAAMQADLVAASRSPTPQAITALTLKYPQLSEHFTRANSMLTEQQRAGEVRALSPIYAAALNSRPDLVERLLNERAAAMENSGMPEEAKEARDMAELVKQAPGQAATFLGVALSSAMGAEKFAENFGKLGAESRAAAKAPAELREAEAKATTAGVTAQFAERNALIDLEKKGWDIKALQSDMAFKKEQNRIAAMNAEASREGNDLKRQELRLKVQEAQQKLDTATREKAAEVESARFNVDNMLNTIERIKKNPSLDDVLGSIEGAMPAMATSWADDEEADAIALIETLGSQAFLSQLPNIKGMGQLSNAEGDKLQAALQNLRRNQSEKQFRTSLDEASRLLIKARENVSRRYGVPDTKPDTPAAPGARPPLSSFNRP